MGLVEVLWWCVSLVILVNLEKMVCLNNVMVLVRFFYSRHAWGLDIWAGLVVDSCEPGGDGDSCEPGEVLC